MFSWFIAWYDHPLEAPSEAQKEKQLFARMVVEERRQRRSAFFRRLLTRLRLV
ncbi:MAG: hypothetical protein MK180_16835 [Rhodobacteraceae bacterium]|nr:hypothetical protein [Paracoccaceae bacterium]